MAFAVIGFAVALGIGVVWLVLLYNGLIAARHECDRSWANIDVLLKQRHDEIPKLVEVCKGYMAHERQTLEAVTAARQSYASARTPTEQFQSSETLSGAPGIGSSRWPNPIRSSEPRRTSMALQSRISGLESLIADRHVSSTTPPPMDGMFASSSCPRPSSPGGLGMSPRDLFQVTAEDRLDVKLGLSLESGRATPVRDGSRPAHPNRCPSPQLEHPFDLW